MLELDLCILVYRYGYPSLKLSICASSCSVGFLSKDHNVLNTTWIRVYAQDRVIILVKNTRSCHCFADLSRISDELFESYNFWKMN